MISKSNYTYQVFLSHGFDFVAIVDIDSGGMSVTNNIDNVIEEICAKEEIVRDEYSYIYMDSTGLWDGYDPKLRCFVPLRCEMEVDAVREYAFKMK